MTINAMCLGGSEKHMGFSLSRKNKISKQCPIWPAWSCLFSLCFCMNSTSCQGEKSSSQRGILSGLATLYWMVALTLKLGNKGPAWWTGASRLSVFLQGYFWDATRHSFAFFRNFQIPFHLACCPVTNKTLLIYFAMPNRAIIFMI